MLRSSITFSRTALPAVACAMLVMVPAGAEAKLATAERSASAAADEDALLQRLLFPEGSGFSVTSFKRSDSGAITEWKTTGCLTAQALNRLAELNALPGMDLLKKTDGSLLVVNLRTAENPKPAAAGDATYPFTFELVITRRPASSR